MLPIQVKPVLLLLFLFKCTLSLHGQNLSDLYERVNPAVVVIRTIEQDDPTGIGTGSGVLISEKGEILTAAHVVNTAEAIAVEFEGENPIPAEVVAAVAEADVALIKLKWLPQKKIAVTKLADSDKVKVGDRVIVIGTPFGIGHSLSAGYISGRHVKKSISDGLTLMELLQTDAAINQGNSGGPMFNEKGEVIGIVSAILTQTGGFQGIGFATTSNIARKLLIEERAFWFGVEGFLLTDYMAQIFNLPQPGGILVQKVASHSPAGAMGVKGGSYKAQIEGQSLLLGGDIIVSFAGVKLDCETSLTEGRKRMTSLKTKDAYTITVFRNGQLVELQSVVP